MKSAKKARGTAKAPAAEKAMRADKQRNLDALLEAAKAVFATSGVDAPVREIAARADVGLATVYRHFPERSDLIAAVFRREVDACAAAAPVLARQYSPDDALARWLHRYADFLAAKRGLAAALHSGDPAFKALPAYFREHLEPAVRSLVEAAIAAGRIGDDVEPSELLWAVGNLCIPVTGVEAHRNRRMVDLLVDGLRVRASEHAGNGKPRPR